MKSLLKRLVDLVIGNRWLDRFLRHRYAEELFPRGHFYSPLPDRAEVAAQADRLFDKDLDAIAGIELRLSQQRQLLEELARFAEDFRWPELPAAGHRYHLDNPAFVHGDAFVLYAMLRHLSPRRVIEVGSGYSSALMLDTRDRFLSPDTHFTFIDPFPERLNSLVSDTDRRSCRIIPEQVQRLPVSTFEALRENDILFIDSSHVSKVGSDVNFLYFEALPTLKPGVVIHVHDVFWPFEYPRAWIDEGRAWNEQYLLRAFLMHNDRYELLLFNHLLARSCSDFLRRILPIFLTNCGCSLWLRKR